MIRPNNPAIEIDDLRERIRSRAESLRVAGTVEQRRHLPRSLSARYHAAAAYLSRAYEFGYPESRLPQKLRALHLFGARPAMLVLRLYNFAFRRAREASAAQTEAIHAVIEAGLATSARLTELELQMTRLREAIEERRRSQP